MLRLLRPFLLSALLCLVARSTIAAQARAPIRLPADPNAEVIVMDRVGGFRGPRLNTRPDLTVRADGVVIAVETEFPDKVFTARLSATELQDLLHFLIEDQSFFQFNAFDVQKQIDTENQRTGTVIDIDDLSTPVIRLTTAERSHESKFNGPRQWSRAYPSIRTLAQLAGVDEKLTRLHEEVKAGWREGIDATLEVANLYLKRDPALPSLVRDDYRRTLYSHAVERQRTAYFERSLAGGRLLSVSVTYPPNAEPQVSVRVP